MRYRIFFLLLGLASLAILVNACIQPDMNIMSRLLVIGTTTLVTWVSFTIVIS